MKTESKYQGLNITDALMDAWDEYVLLYEGEPVIIDYPDNVTSKPTEKGREKARTLLNNIYNHLRPYESEVMKDFEQIKDTYHYSLPEEKRWIRSAAYFCIEYHKQNTVMKMAGLSDSMGETFEIPLERRSKFVDMFGNEKIAQAFLRKLNEIKKERGELDAYSVVSVYNEMLTKYKITGRKLNAKCLYEVISQLNLFLGGRSTLDKEFRENKK